MKTAKQWAAAALLFARATAMALASLTTAQAVTVSLSYLEGTEPVAPDAITAWGPELFGDKVNLFNGALEFEQTDTRLPGNSALVVSITRRYVVGRSWDVRGQFGDWDLETPRIAGTFAPLASGWVTNRGNSIRCSGYSLPPLVSSSTDGSGGFERVAPNKETKAGDQPGATLGAASPDAVVGFIASDYFQGVNITIPGQGSQEVLIRSPAYALQPLNGQSHLLVTRGNWQVACLPSIQNGAGEGFVAVTPDGVSYRFDWMASRPTDDVKKNGASITRAEYSLMATQATDRFGNWVRYTYDPANPWLLQRIESSDGRVITVTNSGGRAVAVHDGTRTFTYSYTAYGNLQQVMQPDGSRWTFNLGGMTAIDLSDMGFNASCDFPGTLPSDNLDGSMTHPSGAVGTFKTRFVYLGRTYVDRYCKFAPNSTLKTTGAVYPRVFGSQALLSKSITGPGMQDMNWTYSYGSTYGWNPCTGCTDRRVVIVTDPGGGKTAHQFGIRWRVNEGQLLQVDEGWTGSSWLKSTVHRYRVGGAPQNYPDQFGSSLLSKSDYLASRNRPLDQRTTTQQGTTFTWQADTTPAGFDGLARPIKVSQFSSLSPALTTVARSEATELDDNLPLWVLGQKKRVVELTSGREVERHTFDNSKALKSASYSFGLLVNSFAYRVDGTLETLFDAANRPIAFQNFMRGKPQWAGFADGSIASRVVNNLGNVVSDTNEVGTTTHYTFDAMGRVASINYPTGDPVAYAPTNQSFTQVFVNEYGLAPGHWLQTVNTGSGWRKRYFDGLWRVRLEHRYDATNPGATQSFLETRYDADNRKAFESYPSRSFNLVDQALAGQSTSYDSLDRVVQQRADSELGVLTTTTEYLNGFQRRVTNPRGFATTHAFQAFDTPSEDRIASIGLADGSSVAIWRDIFGKPSHISRWGTYAGSTQQVTRTYTYDLHQRLCKTVEPETGATVQGYDTAGNLAWRASGQPFSAATVCEDGGIAESTRIRFGYDARDRLLNTSYGDASQQVSRRYTLDGLLSYIGTTGGGVHAITWTYIYNNRRLLSQERYSWGAADPNYDWIFARQYDTNGHVSALSDRLGWIDFAPNALGQAGKVSSYATGVAYHPNGAVASYTLGNGIQHITSQNVRGLPTVMRDADMLHDAYTYDANGNVTGIVDGLPGGANSRSMPVYDELDRLRQAQGPWGNASFNYDALDNLVVSTVGARILTHRIDPTTNRLAELSGSQSLLVGYDPNGNITQRGSQGFVFDIGNRLRSATDKAVYVYDGHGRRNVAYGGGSWVLQQAYTQDGKLRYTRRVPEGERRHVFLGDKLIAETSAAGVTTYAHTDLLGSPVAWSGGTSGAPTLISRTRYEPYGATVAGSTVPEIFGFTGHVNDANTGLVYMQQRYYDPIAGRFLSVDPVTTDEKTGDHFNRYDYVGNNPYKYVDPTGKIRVEAAVGSGAGGSSLGGFGGSLGGGGGGGRGAAPSSSAISGNAVSSGTAARSPSASVNAPAPAGNSGSGSSATGSGPNFIVTPGGTAFPVPTGATGPTPVVNPAGNQTGSAFTGGSGGQNGQVSTMRIMNANPSNPTGYIKYENNAQPKAQGVDPYSGRTVSPDKAHKPIDR